VWVEVSKKIEETLDSITLSEIIKRYEKKGSGILK
jgi:DNA-binding IscR family transcriptional regulator